MSQTSFSYVDSTLGLVEDFWSPIFERELRENTLWPGLLYDPNYTMEKVKGGDTFKISRINKPSSSIRSIGTNADSFDTNVLSSTQVDLQVNKRAVSAYEFEDLSVLMSQLEQQDSEIRNALLADVREQLNDHIKSLIVPSASAPDHTLTSVTDFSLAQLSIVRTLAAAAKWGSAEPWYLLAAPSYYSDMLDDTTLGASDSMGIDKSPVLEGRFVMKRMGFNIIEDDSLATDTAFAFIPSFLKVIFGQPRFKISDLHGQKKFGYIISVDLPCGAVQQDDERVISIA
jgi:hypothetical protein